VVIERRAARALLLAGRSVLLIRGHDPGRPDAGPWWLAPGGGVQEDETAAAALVREVHEETGLRLAVEQVGPVVATRLARFEFELRRYRQTESFFAVRLDARFEPVRSGWDDAERRSLIGHRWWDLSELAATIETVYPAELAEVCTAVLDTQFRAPIQLPSAE
jgi:8-oxo-dGTP pyrophosphatase MutT (NUDIX family)